MRNKPDESVSRLCPNCGLCCNGVLFADVELRKGDDTKHLEKLGLELEKKGRSKLAFAQPCSCFDGKLCAIYDDRPKYCRAFECGLLKRVTSGELKADSALKTIARTKAKAETVHVLLRQSGNHDENLALMARYSKVMRSPVDLSAAGDAPTRQGKLMRAVDRLMQLLQQNFLQ